MPVLSARAVKKCLTSKLKCETEEGHHTQYILVEDGQEISSTYMSHGSDKDLDTFIVKMMAKQLNISRHTFVEAVKCTASRDDVLAEIARRQ